MAHHPTPPKTILIVEDDGITAARIEDILSDRGYATTSVGSGEEAVALAKHSPPDLALMDIHLYPEMDGVTAAEQIRAIGDTPVIFLTAYSDDALLRRARATAPHGYLIKPVRDRELLATLEMALYKHETDRQIQAERERLAAERREMEKQRHYSQKMESLGIMAGAMAHHFNNLLSVILGHTEMLQSDPATPPSLQNSLNEILKAGTRAGEIIEQMMIFRGQFPWKRRAVNLTDLVREIWPMVEWSAGPRVALHRDLDGALPTALLDPHRIQQVVISLTANAAEAIGDEGGQITVRTGRLMLHPSDPDLSESLRPEGSGPDPCIFLSVTDTGEGMDEQTRKKIFDPFFTTRFQGRGLGLSAVLGIVRGHGGTVKVLSRPGSGTTVQILFPEAV